MLRRPLLLGTIGVIACWACGMNAVDDNGSLSFEIREGYYVDPPPPPPQIALILTTATVYPCFNYHLESSFAVAGGTLRVNVSGRVTKPDVCLTAIGPAQYRVALPVTVGTYNLEFVRDGVTDSYSVTVTDTSIDISTNESHFTQPTAASFPRVP